MSVQMNIERQPAIQRGNLTIDPQYYTVTLAGEEIDLYPKEFDVLCLLTQYPGWHSILVGCFLLNRFMEPFGRNAWLDVSMWSIM